MEQPSLVQYEGPILINRIQPDPRAVFGECENVVSNTRPLNSKPIRPPPKNRVRNKDNFGGTWSSSQAKALRSGKGDRVASILMSMLPNREWVEEGPEGGKMVWSQTVSRRMGSREDLLKLKERLQQQMETLQARPQGICPVREQLTSELFDELIRQITIECPERGLVLLRLRDELRMRLAAYLEVRRGGATFGTGRQEKAHTATRETQARLDELEADVESKRMVVRQMQMRLEQARDQAEVARAGRSQFHASSMEQLRKQRKMLENFILKSQQDST